MSLYQNDIQIQINLIEEAMKNAGVWSHVIPEWIVNYDQGQMVDVWQWLQFIHLPMRVNGSMKQTKYLAPLLSQYIKENKDHHRILQLVIELDGITSTIAKP